MGNPVIYNPWKEKSDITLSKADIKITETTLKIVSPSPNQIFTIDPEKLEMPIIKVCSILENGDVVENAMLTKTAKIEWQLHIYGKYKISRGGKWEQYHKSYTLETKLNEEGSFVLGDYVIGGFCIVKASLCTNTCILHQEQYIDIRGQNPTKESVQREIDDILTEKTSKDVYDSDLIKKIICQESSYRQFKKSAESREGLDIRLPKGSQNPKIYRPIFGFPAGIGIAQLDPASKFPDEHWNWKINLKKGIEIYYKKKKVAYKIYKNQQEILNYQLKSLIKKANLKRKELGQTELVEGDYQIDVESDYELTDDQMKKNIVNLYNGGFSFKLDYIYSINENHEIETSGTENWIEERVRRAGNKWVTITNGDQNYYNNVMSCD